MLTAVLAFVFTLAGLLGLAVVAFAGLGGIPMMGAISFALVGLSLTALSFGSVPGAILLGGLAILLGTTTLGLWMGKALSGKIR